MASPGLAKKGGNGGGKPGGGYDPPAPTLPVTYGVTPIHIPGTSSSLYGHNESGALVGVLRDSTDGSQRALAYLPNYSADAFYLDDPSFGLTGVPTGWHAQRAVDVNNLGMIVGNVAPNDAAVSLARAFVATGTDTNSPSLSVLPLIAPDAEQEVAVAINDDGDVVVRSEKIVDGTTAYRLFVGNVGADGFTTASFVEIDFASHGLAGGTMSGDLLHISNREEGGAAVVVGEIAISGERHTFRVNSDGSNFENAPSYYREDGSLVEWTTNWGTLDVDNAGNVTGGAEIYPVKQGKLKYNLHAGFWEYGSNEILPVGDFDAFQSEWWTAAQNDDGDFLLQVGQGVGDALWHGDWSPANGELDIASLIDPKDPYAHLYRSTFDLTNRDVHGWPTILAEGYEALADGTNQPYWLVLTPQSTATLGSTTIPEPASILLGFLAVSSLAVFRRVI